MTVQHLGAGAVVIALRSLDYLEGGMIGSIRCVAISLLIAAGHVYAGAGPEQAGTFSKGPYACFAEVCIGDRIEDLSAIALTPAPPLGPPNNPGDRDARNRYPGVHRNAMGFWEESLYRTLYEGRFDSSFVMLAERYSDFCPQRLETNKHYRFGKFRLTGQYKTESGLPTEIVVDLMPDASELGLRARFYVTELSRWVPVNNSVEGESVVRSVEERYREYSQPTSRQSLVTARFDGNSTQPHVRITIAPSDSRAWGGYDPNWAKVARSGRCSSGASPGID
jgi:hypothetical protein